MRINHLMLEGAKNYAQADRSDPFTFNRVMSHLQNGVATASIPTGKNGYYEAEKYKEERSFKNAEGETINYTVDAFRNMARP